MTRRLVGPFNRVEGDLEVELDIRDGRITEARVNSPLFRGFERILEGRPPLDALAIVPRICGICSISQSMAAAATLRALSGVEPPEAGVLSAQVVHAAENIADHVSHFYLFFMPDFARDVYAGRQWHDAVRKRFAAGSGSASAAMLPARARLLTVMGPIIGKWPHTLAIQPGGVTKSVDRGERQRIRGALRDFRRFAERDLLGVPVETFAALGSVADLEACAAEHEDSDVARFLAIANDLELDGVGVSEARFLSVGAYELPEGSLFAGGLFDARAGKTSEPDFESLREDSASSWMAGGALHPFEGRTDPDPDRAGAYSWCKAPRLDGHPVEVGALARQLVDGQPLVRDFVARRGRGVTARMVARIVETARCLLGLETWVSRLEPGAPVYEPAEIPRSGRACGMVEAARGSLGHWVTVEAGRISRYQIISPTTWNFSPRDAEGRPGPLETALAGLAADEGSGDAPVTVQHVVRSFDPCMVCTVH